MNKLSVIITFKNEGDELARTIKDARETAGDKIDIIVNNDNSDDNYDYEAALKPYDVLYLSSDVRLGTSLGREYCISHCTTPYFIIIDGHCRFATKDWYDKAIEVMEKDEDCIYCCACNYFTDEKIMTPQVYGAYFRYTEKAMMNCSWNRRKLSETEFEIPCILGANYLCSMRWWKRIRGLEGLKLYGRDEPYLSRKSWMLGGSVKCIPQIATLHKKRENGMPYKTSYTESLYNELVMASVLCQNIFGKVLKHFYKKYPKAHIDRIYNQLKDNNELVSDLHSYVEQHKVKSYEDVEQLNTKFRIDTNQMK